MCRSSPFRTAGRSGSRRSARVASTTPPAPGRHDLIDDLQQGRPRGVHGVCERANSLLRTTFKALPRVSLDPDRNTQIAAVALVLLQLETTEPSETITQRRDPLLGKDSMAVWRVCDWGNSPVAHPPYGHLPATGTGDALPECCPAAHPGGFPGHIGPHPMAFSARSSSHGHRPSERPREGTVPQSSL